MSVAAQAAEAAAAASPSTALPLARYQIARVFSGFTAKINSIDFDPTGELLLAASHDESLHLYRALAGSESKVLHSKKYGVRLARFTHAKHTVICASATTRVQASPSASPSASSSASPSSSSSSSSRQAFTFKAGAGGASKGDERHDLRLWSTYDNTFIRYFRGHTAKVLDVDLCPQSDEFITSSADHTVRVWDARTPECAGVISDVTGRNAVVYDNSGVVFAVAGGRNSIQLFDARKFSAGSFTTFHVPLRANEPTVEFTGMKFSPDDSQLLVTTSQNRLVVLDAFEGTLQREFSSHANRGKRKLQCGWTPDGKSIFSGSEDSKVHVWDATTGVEQAALEGHSDVVAVVQFNPKFNMMASGCTQLALWLPPEDL